MEKYILSEQVREYLKDINHEFTDYEKATIILYAPLYCTREKINDVIELANRTNEEKLKNKIESIIYGKDKIRGEDRDLLTDFVNIPYPSYFEKGIIVKDLITNEYGVIATSVDEWNNTLEKIKVELNADYFDMAIEVYYLNTNGIWSRSLVNPIYLKVEYPNEFDLHTRALDAMSGYLSHNGGVDEEQRILEVCKEYALSNNYMKVFKATRLSDIMD